MRKRLESIIKAPVKAAKKTGNYVVNTVKSKAYWVDTLTAMSFFQPIKFFNEMVVNDFTFYEALDVRKIGIPVSLAITRPVCQLRDAWKKNVWKVNKNSSKKRKILADLSFLTIAQPTIYAGVLLAKGVEPERIPKTVATGYLATLALASVYVPYLEFTRKLFKTTPYEQEILPDIIKD